MKKMNTKTSIYQLMYLSHTPHDVSDEQINNILIASRRNNMRDSITGLLIYHNQLFMQILEGDKNDVQRCYERVLNDPRHGSPSIIWEEEVADRSFPQWQMGFNWASELDERKRKSVLTLARLREKNGDVLDGNSTVEELARAIMSDFK
jgi:hypothetical protein